MQIEQGTKHPEASPWHKCTQMFTVVLGYPRNYQIRVIKLIRGVACIFPFGFSFILRPAEIVVHNKFSCPTSNFYMYFLWHGQMGLSPLEDVLRTYHIHLWPLHDLDLWSQYQNNIFTMNLCLGKIVFALWHRHTIFGTWVYHYETTCCVHSWPLYDLDLWSLSGW